MSHSALSLPMSLSLWSTIAPFDHHGHFLNRWLWPLLGDWQTMQAMMVNRSTMAHVRYFTVRRVFKVSELLTQSRGSAGRYRPCIATLIEADLDTLDAAFSQLSHVTSLSLSILRPPRPRDVNEWTEQLPPSLTSLHLIVSSKAWRVLRSSQLPDVLHELTIDDSIVQSAELISGPLPPHIHTLHIRSRMWDWHSFQRLHLPPDNTQLRVLSLTNLVDTSLLPHSLTELDTSGCDYNDPLRDFSLPNLVVFRLGSNVGSYTADDNLPLAADSFAGLPALRELDLYRALSFVATLPAGVLPATLTSLSLPLNYTYGLCCGALPPALERLQIAHAVDQNSSSAPGANELEDGCLHAGLLALIVSPGRGTRRWVSAMSFTYHLSILPTTLVELRMDNRLFNQSLDALTALPHLTTLSIDSWHFAQPLDAISHLARLHILELYIHFPSPFPTLPSQLRHLTVRPPSDMPRLPERYYGPLRGYTHQLTAAQFAQCDRLESLSIDADVYAGDWYDQSSTFVYVFENWTQQQRNWPLFDWPIAAAVLPASLQRLRLPQRYQYASEIDERVVPLHCRVMLGRERVR